MKEQMMEIITSHNQAIESLENLELPITGSQLFKAMEFWHKMAISGSYITHLARELGIEAKCNMQTGKIFVEHVHNMESQ